MDAKHMQPGTWLEKEIEAMSKWQIRKLWRYRAQQRMVSAAPAAATRNRPQYAMILVIRTPKQGHPFTETATKEPPVEAPTSTESVPKRRWVPKGSLRSPQQGPPPGPPNVPLLRALWSLFDGMWGILKGSWGVLAMNPMIRSHESIQGPSVRP